MRLSVQEPLALGAGEQRGCPFPIRQVAGVGAEIELCEVARQMRFADVVKRPVDAAFEQREMAFDRVGMREAAEPDVFLGAVIDARMAGEFVADRPVNRAAVRHQVRFAIGVLDEDRAQVCARHVGDVEALGASVAIASLEYLTDERLSELEDHFGIQWKTYSPFYGVRWAMRPLLAKLQRKREPSRFRLYVAEVAK